MNIAILWLFLRHQTYTGKNETWRTLGGLITLFSSLQQSPSKQYMISVGAFASIIEVNWKNLWTHNRERVLVLPHTVEKKKLLDSRLFGAILKALANLECCFLNRIKAQIFFLCSQINNQQPIKAGGHILASKYLMSEEVLITWGRAAQDRSPFLSSVIITLLSGSHCWQQHHYQRIIKLQGMALALTSQSSGPVCHF